MTDKIKLQKWGNSQGVRIPLKMLEELSLSIGDEVEFEASIEEGSLVLKPVFTMSPYEKLFEGYDFSQAQNKIKLEGVDKEYWS